MYKSSLRKGAAIGKFIKVSVKRTRPNNKILKKTKTKAVIVRTKKIATKADGSNLRFKTNSCVLLKKRMTPRGRELFGPISNNVRRKKFMSTFIGIL